MASIGTRSLLQYYFNNFSTEFSCRNSIEKFAMYICRYSVHMTMEDLRVRNIVF